jgi:membrane protease YdiL (CAAX protease family)
MQNPVHTQCVRRLYIHDGIKTLLAMLGALAAALLCLPVSYRLANALVEITADKQTNAVLHYLSNFFQTATLIDLFRVNFLFCLAVACMLLFARLRKSLGLINIHKRPWSLLIPAHDCGEGRDYKLRKNPLAFHHGISGLLLAIGLIFSVVWYFYHGSLQQVSISNPLSPVLVKIFWALLVVVLMELMLRGVLLGIWLRNSSPFSAILFVALIGAAGSFLQTPSAWVDPQQVNLSTGLTVMKAMFFYGITEKVWWGNFIPTFTIGVLLGLARYRTSSLWLSWGLHMGIGICGFLWSLRFSTQLLPLPAPIQVGISVLIAVVVAGMIVIMMTHKKETP